MADIWDTYRTSSQPVCHSRPEWSFFWGTDLTNPQMTEICAWLATLSPQQRMYIDKLTEDRISEYHFDHCAGEDT